ncbi:partial Glutathione transport system permease protein GsiD, partial [Burkholderiales bacterium]
MTLFKRAGSSSVFTESPLSRVMANFCESKVALVSLAVLVVLLLLAIFAPWVTPQNPYDLAQLNVLDARLAPGGESFDGSRRFWLGTDGQGRDVYSAMVYGLRTSLFAGFAATLIAVCLGAPLGLLAAYYGGWLETAIMRLVDLQLSFPPILIALVLVFAFGSGLDKVIIALVAVQWAYHARTIRSAAVVERRREYVEAARCLALSDLRTVFSHLLPNSLPPVIVVATINVA